MSAVWAPLSSGDESRESRPLRDRGRLKVVPRPPARMARIPFIAVLIALFGAGMAGLLMLNTTLQNQAFEGRALTRQANELIYSQAELESAISRRSSPEELARRASALGMRPNPHPAFLVVPSGKVIGKPTRVQGREVPALVIKTPEEVAAARAAAEAKRKAAAVEKAARERGQQLAAARRAADQRTRATQQAAAARVAAVQKAAAQKAAAQRAAAQRAAAQRAAAQRAAQLEAQRRAAGGNG